MSMIADLVMRIPIRKWQIDELPDIGIELCESLMFSLLLFVNIISSIYGSRLETWDHSSLVSRSAASIASSTGLKFVMDVNPASALYCLSAFVKQGEYVSEDKGSLIEYVANYEALIVSKFNLMGCFNNHYVEARLLLRDLENKGRITPTIYARASEVSIFFAFNYMADWDTHSVHKNVKLSGASVAVLSVECLRFAGLDTSSVRMVEAADVYEFASTIAYHIGNSRQKDTQSHLPQKFNDSSKWQHTCTKNVNVMLCRASLKDKSEAMRTSHSVPTAAYGEQKGWILNVS